MAAESIRLVGTHEIREMLGGVSRQRVNQLYSRDGFPRPVADLGQGKVWRAEDVEAWIQVHRSDWTGADL